MQIVAVQTELVEVVENYTPIPLLETGAACYIGLFKGKYWLYERTSGLNLPTCRGHYTGSIHDRTWEFHPINPKDQHGFTTIAGLKRFYEETNPAFEAENECTRMASLISVENLKNIHSTLAKNLWPVVYGIHGYPPRDFKKMREEISQRL